MRVEVAGVESVVISINRLNTTMGKAAGAMAEAMGLALMSRVRKNISRTDYTLGALAWKKHPYAKKHGSIQASVLGGAFKRQPYLVHTRSSQMISSLKGKKISVPSGKGYEVRLSGSHSKWVVQGTKRMLRRDVLVDTVNMKKTLKEMRKAAILKLGAELRAGATIRGFKITKLKSHTEK